MRLIALIFATISFVSGADRNSSACFAVNGDPAPQHSPCFPDLVEAGGDSSCCEFSKTDVCLDTGLCFSAGGMIFQAACTDKNWQSNSCPHRCPDR